MALKTMARGTSASKSTRGYWTLTDHFLELRAVFTLTETNHLPVGSDGWRVEQLVSQR